MFTWLRTRPESKKRPASFRPSLETLDQRIVPANAHFVTASSSISDAGVLSATFKEAGLGNNQNIDYTLTATVDSVAERGLFVTRDGLIVRAEATGRAGVSVKQR